MLFSLLEERICLEVSENTEFYSAFLVFLSFVGIKNTEIQFEF